MNNVYIFKSEKTGYEVMEEKHAHNYLRHRSNWERKDLVYIGCVNSKDLQIAQNLIFKKIDAKYGKWSSRTDEQHEESRLEADILMKEEQKKMYALADKSILPRNYDWIGNEKGEILENKAIFSRFR